MRRAAEHCKGKVISVTGTLRDIRQTIFSRYPVEYGKYLLELENNGSSLTCFCDLSDADRMQLHKGARMTLAGRFVESPGYSSLQGMQVNYLLVRAKIVR